MQTELDRTGDPAVYGQTCRVAGCGRSRRRNGYCDTHSHRLSYSGSAQEDLPIRRRIANALCELPGCGRRHKAGGLCGTHYAARLRTGDPLSARPRPRKALVNGHGYIYVFHPEHPNAGGKGYVLEHRYVMSQRLGRPLLDSEDVHHINGNKLDNRDENLELWVRSQPRGQRAKDLVEWAREILERYGKCP